MTAISGHHQMSLGGGGAGLPGLISSRVGTLPCDLSHDAFDVTFFLL